MSLSHTFETLGKDITNLQLNFSQILTSGCHYNTIEIINHIKNINNALDNIKLDYELQRGSKNSTKKIDSNEMNIKQLISKGNELSQELNTRLHTMTIKNKEHNQIREIHNWTCSSLLEYLQSLYPYASGSYTRLDNLAHDLGVTDRYVGYRNNLTRYGNQPVTVHTIWADRKLPRSSTPDWKDLTHSFQHNNLSKTTVQQTSNYNQKVLNSIETKHPTEIQHFNTTKNITSQSFVYANDYNTHLNKAGLNINYPGKTESAISFTKPEEISSSLFLPVAQPDYTLPGRPLAHLVPGSIATEYIQSYTYPDAAKVERYPWLRPY
ncbi:unnamed protein product [Rotaria sp. Silwood1]|nr:unnamed protein product [Rotaria sp. Silwood1]CAF3880278.1 unnamed protein product [Rotaria sp. Silwood1]CAF4997530.1 unnamed protein product [Rotaria sp. Silwood1]CAF5008220.1 unnamed protein product [Rotaria sp. Silwood1]